MKQNPERYCFKKEGNNTLYLIPESMEDAFESLVYGIDCPDAEQDFNDLFGEYKITGDKIQLEKYLED